MKYSELKTLIAKQQRFMQKQLEEILKQNHQIHVLKTKPFVLQNMKISGVKFTSIDDGSNNDYDVEFFIHFGDNEMLKFESQCTEEERPEIELVLGHGEEREIHRIYQDWGE